jgi:hypothetical protein
MSDQLIGQTTRMPDSSPDEVFNRIEKLATDFSNAKDNLNKIKDRGFLKKIVSNTTKDLAEAMIRQNDSISAFLTIVRELLSGHLTNVVLLTAVMRKIEIEEKTNHLRDNKYLGVARVCVTEALKTAERNAELQKEIQNFKNELESLASRHSEQERLLAKIIDGLTQKKFLEGYNEDVFQMIIRQSERFESQVSRLKIRFILITAIFAVSILAILLYEIL